MSDRKSKFRLMIDSLGRGEIEISGDDAHYVRNVLRLRRNDLLELCDGNNNEATAEILRVDKNSILLDVGASRRLPDLPCDLTVGLPAPKGERADWVVEKLTELGAKRIVWITCERAVTQPRKAGARSERYERVAKSAAGQCGRGTILSVDGPLPLDELLAIPAEMRWLGDAGGDAPQIHSPPPKTAILLIGPEGGLVDQEISRACKAGYTRVRLSSLTLRVETAAVLGTGLLLAGSQR